MRRGRAKATLESKRIRSRKFLARADHRDQTQIWLPFSGVRSEFSLLRHGSYTCVRGTRRARRRLLMLTVGDAMLQDRRLFITAVLPFEGEYRWLCDLHATFVHP